GHRDLVGALAPLWEQARILSVGWDATVRAWNLQTGDVIACLEPTGDKLFSVESVVRIPSSDDVVIGFGLYGYCLGIWNVNRPTHLDKWGGQKDAILDLDLSAERRQLLAAIGSGLLLLWDLDSKTLLRRFEGSFGPLYAARFHPAGNFAFSGGADGIVRMWELQTGRCVQRFLGHAAPVRALSCTPDGAWLVSCGD